MNKTKIVASVGPISYRKGILEEMIINGADVIRLNMSYSDYNFCTQIIEEINELNKELNSSVAVMLELEGSVIHTGKFKGGAGHFKTGDKIRMYVSPKMGSDFEFSVDCSILDSLEKHSIIKLSEGKVILEVLQTTNDYALCEVIRGGLVKSMSKVYLPSTRTNGPFLTKQDKEDIVFASKMNADFLVISNVFSEEDILEVNDLIIELNNDHISVLTKLSNDIAIKKIDKIIDLCDGVIIARNDLAITVPIENVPVIKNEVISKCLKCGKISMISADLSSFLADEINPSRAEVSDLSSAVLLGVDSIVLSSETTVGHYPVDAIKQVEKIISVSEKNIDHQYFYDQSFKTEIKNISGTIIANCALSVLNLNVKAIVVATNNGFAAKKISRFRPPCPIIAVTPNDDVAKSLNLHFGVVAVVTSDYDFDTLSSKATYLSEKILNLEKHDKIIVIGSHPFDEDNINFLKIIEI